MWYFLLHYNKLLADCVRKQTRHIGDLSYFFLSPLPNVFFVVVFRSLIVMDLLDVMELDNTINLLPANNASNSLQPLVFALSVPTDVTTIAHVRLPCFWGYSPKQQFTHVEAIFHINRIRANLTRVSHMFAALDEKGVRTVTDLLDPNIEYSMVRNPLITTYSTPQTTWFRTIV